MASSSHDATSVCTVAKGFVYKGTPAVIAHGRSHLCDMGACYDYVTYARSTYGPLMRSISALGVAPSGTPPGPRSMELLRLASDLCGHLRVAAEHREHVHPTLADDQLAALGLVALLEHQAWAERHRCRLVDLAEL